MPSSQPLSDSPQARFQVLLGRHGALVAKVAATYCADPEDRRDLAQEIRAHLWRSFPGYDASRPFPTWAYRVALNVAITQARRAARRRQTLDSYDAQDAEPVDPGTLSDEADDRARAFARAVEGLGPFDRALLVLHLDGYRHPEIADVLGISPSNVGTRLSRLRQRLAADLAPTMP